MYASHLLREYIYWYHRHVVSAIRNTFFGLPEVEIDLNDIDHYTYIVIPKLLIRNTCLVLTSEYGMNHHKSKTRTNKNIFLVFLLVIKVWQINEFYAINKSSYIIFAIFLEGNYYYYLSFISCAIFYRFHISLYAMSSKTKLTHKKYTHTDIKKEYEKVRREK